MTTAVRTQTALQIMCSTHEMWRNVVTIRGKGTAHDTLLIVRDIYVESRTHVAQIVTLSKKAMAVTCSIGAGMRQSSMNAQKRISRIRLCKTGLTRRRVRQIIRTIDAEDGALENVSLYCVRRLHLQKQMSSGARCWQHDVEKRTAAH